MTAEEQWSKFLIKCPKCGNIFLPWKCLSITNETSNWRTFSLCPSCKAFFDRDSSYLIKNGKHIKNEKKCNRQN